MPPQAAATPAAITPAWSMPRPARRGPATGMGTTIGCPADGIRPPAAIRWPSRRPSHVPSSGSPPPRLTARTQVASGGSSAPSTTTASPSRRQPGPHGRLVPGGSRDSRGSCDPTRRPQRGHQDPAAAGRNAVGCRPVTGVPPSGSPSQACRCGRHRRITRRPTRRLRQAVRARHPAKRAELANGNGMARPCSRPGDPERRSTPEEPDSGHNAPGRIRTCDLQIRNPMLYPAELRVPRPHRTAGGFTRRESDGTRRSSGDRPGRAGPARFAPRARPAPGSPVGNSGMNPGQRCGFRDTLSRAGCSRQMPRR